LALFFNFNYDSQDFNTSIAKHGVVDEVLIHALEGADEPAAWLGSVGSS